MLVFIAFIAALVAFIIALILRIDPRVPIGLGLGLFAACALALMLKQRDLANLLATVTYFLLVFGTSLATVRLIWAKYMTRNRGTSQNDRASG